MSDLTDYLAAKATDDGVRVPLEELVAELHAAVAEIVAATTALARRLEHTGE